MFACLLNNSTSSQNIALTKEGCNVSFFDSIREVSNEWNSHVGDQQFMRSAFLTALEETPPSGTSFRYGLVRNSEELIGVIYYQVKIIDLRESLRMDLYSPKGFWDNLWHRTKSMLAKPLKAHVLVCGNMTLTGSNGYVFKNEVPQSDQCSIIGEVSQELVCQLKKEKINVRAILIKDFFNTNKPDFSNSKFSEFSVQPNMIMQIDPEWASFEDYLRAMKSKYKVRVRRARKKAVELTKRVLTLEEIHAYSDDISRLYRNVADQAGFNLFILPKNYFYSLQKHLGESMKTVAYFDGDRMVGYYTNILSHGDLDAHFLGYDPDCNRKSQLYLNMLYDLVEDAIDVNANNLIMSRTALEIKSSVGAKAHDMSLFMKTVNPIMNLGVARGLKYFTPEAKWQPRSPFK